MDRSRVYKIHPCETQGFMNILEQLGVDCVSIDLVSSEKEAIIEEMVDMLDAAGKIPDRAAALTAILEREKKMSTGMQNGIAIPHGKSDTIEDLVAGLAIHKAGVDFASLDGQDARIFVMTLSPANRTGPHIQFLSETSRLLGDEQTRAKLLAAGSREEVLDILSSA
jgi:PTS system nitrogen regulatory IIA component